MKPLALFPVFAAGLAAGWGLGTWSTTRLERADCERRIAEAPPKSIRVESADMKFTLEFDLGTQPRVARAKAPEKGP